MSNNSITVKAVNHFVEAINDNRFNPELFASFLSYDEDRYTADIFHRIVLAYLQTKALEYNPDSPQYHSVIARDLLSGLDRNSL